MNGQTSRAIWPPVDLRFGMRKQKSGNELLFSRIIENIKRPLPPQDENKELQQVRKLVSQFCIAVFVVVIRKLSQCIVTCITEEIIPVATQDLQFNQAGPLSTASTELQQKSSFYLYQSAALPTWRLSHSIGRLCKTRLAVR